MSYDTTEKKQKPTPVSKFRVSSPANSGITIFCTMTEVGTKRKKGGYFTLGLTKAVKDDNGNYTYEPKEFLNYGEMLALKDAIDLALEGYNASAGTNKMMGLKGQSPEETSSDQAPKKSALGDDDINF